MEFRQFFKLIQAIRKLSSHADTVSSFGVDIGGMSELINKTMKPLFETVFTPDQMEVLEWWLYDCPNAISSIPDPKYAYVRDIKTGIKTPLHTEREFYDYLMTLKGPTQ